MDKINPEDTIRDLEKENKKLKYDLNRLNHVFNETVSANNFCIRKMHQNILDLQLKIDFLRGYDTISIAQ